MATRFDQRSTRDGNGGGDGTAARAEERLDNLLARVPGYRGYRDKEDRRDADRAIRDEVATSLDAVAARVQAVASDLARRRLIREVGTVDDWVRALQTLAQRVRLAPAGYGGIFSDRDVDAALDQLRQFDEGLLAETARLEDPVEALEAALVAEGDLAGPVRDGMAVTRLLATRFDARETVSSSGDPLPAGRVREVLVAPAAEADSPAWGLDDGVAIAVAGDDYLVDARLDITAGPASLRLFRLTSGTEEWWLMVTPGPMPRLARLRSKGGGAPAPPSAGNLPVNGTVELIGAAGSSGVRLATVSVVGGENPGEEVSVSVVWSGDEAMTLDGVALDDSEIEIYGRPDAAGTA